MSAALALDLRLVGNATGRVSVAAALKWSALWVMLALAFCGMLWGYLDAELGRQMANLKATEFLTGYVIEKSLAVDNIFVFLMLFSYFAVPPEFHRRVLVFGVIGALVLRAIMVLVGAWLIAHFHWILYLFGFFLLVTGIKMLWFAGQKPDLEANPALRWMRSHLRVTSEFHGERFLVNQNGLR